MATTPPPNCIVCFAMEDYWYHPIRSRRHLMERLARRGWRVLFVNSIGMRAPARGHPDFWMRIRRKLRSWARWMRRPDAAAMPTFWVASPIALPFFGSAAARAFNDLALRVQLRLMMWRAGIRRPVLWFGLPTMAPLLGRIPARLTVLHNSDNYAAWPELEGDLIARSMDTLLRGCDIVISASKQLAEECAATNPRSFHLPHGIDAEHFARARHDPALCIPDDLAAIPRPRFGYVGSVGQVLDHALIAHIAEARPAWHQVFVGQYSREVDALRERFPDRIYFLGQRPYEEVPAYMRGLDAGYMPLLNDAWSKYANHLKMREYFAAARPMATIPHAEVAGAGAGMGAGAGVGAESARNPLIHIGGPDYDDFVRAMEAGLAHAGELLDPATGMVRPGPRLDELAPLFDDLSRATWDARVDELERLFAEHARA